MLQVVSYGISINLVEVTWKGKIKQQFPNPNDYSSFMGDFSSATGMHTPIRFQVDINAAGIRFASISRAEVMLQAQEF
jgi:ATP/ADP translocase